MTGPALTALFFLQLACILAACRLVGWLASRVGQPQVIAEMVTGFLLGPSFLGWFAEPLHHWLFPVSTLPIISMISQVGLVLYMFCVGLEFRVELVARSRRRAIALSVAGIAGPLVLGTMLALYLLGVGGLFTERVTATQAAMFTGTALSITAFPVLARIIGERGIAGTTIGSLALSAGAIDDAVAWMLLAVVLGSFTGHVAPAIIAVGGGIGYAAAVLLGVRALLNRPVGAEERDVVSPAMFTTVLASLMLGAWFTETIGIHAVFGAFILGVSFPRDGRARELRRLIEPVTGTLLVPLFFVYAGLHTELRLLDTAQLWMIAALIFGAACCGKGLACWLGAYWSGATKREAFALATLMNARGMVELILIDIGLTRGLITPTLYTMLVLMAIGTTLMAGPLFGRVWQHGRDGVVETGETDGRRVALT
jgi:Kef-type K+ transport system membrane component KefB